MQVVTIMYRDDKAQSRDDFVAVKLINWARAINAGWQDGPGANPQGPLWPSQIKQGYVDDESLPPPIDEDDAEATQHAMIRMMIHDMLTANILIGHYRDNRNVQGLRRARNRFWRWLN